jgi:hypothetical protein
MRRPRCSPRTACRARLCVCSCSRLRDGRARSIRRRRRRRRRQRPLRYRARPRQRQPGEAWRHVSPLRAKFAQLEHFVNANLLALRCVLVAADQVLGGAACAEALPAMLREQFWVASDFARLGPLLAELEESVAARPRPGVGAGAARGRERGVLSSLPPAASALALPAVSVEPARGRRSFVVRQSELPTVIARLSERLPQQRSDGQGIARAMRGDSQICSCVYLDNVQLEGYHTRVAALVASPRPRPRSACACAGSHRRSRSSSSLSAPLRTSAGWCAARRSASTSATCCPSSRASTRARNAWTRWRARGSRRPRRSAPARSSPRRRR